jgi:hypothetical protein
VEQKAVACRHGHKPFRILNKSGIQHFLIHLRLPLFFFLSLLILPVTSDQVLSLS